MQHLIVHIGMHKTGSSSIQDSLAAGLDHPDFDYLAFGQPNGSLAVVQAFDDRFEKRPAVKNRNLTPEEREQIRARGLGSITKAFDASQAPNAIVSAEDIRGLSPAALQVMFDLYKSYTDSIQVVSYIREPRGLIESSFQQILKMVAVTFEAPALRVNYGNHFRKFDDLLGRENNQLWLFNPAEFADGDIVMDFCNRLSIPFDTSKVVRSNESLSLDAVRILWCYRMYNPTFARTDRAIVDRLMPLKGEKLSFTQEMLDLVSGGVDARQVQIVEERMQRTFIANSFDKKPGNVRSLADLEAVSDEGRDWLARETGVAVSSVADSEGVSQALQRLIPAQ